MDALRTLLAVVLFLPVLGIADIKQEIIDRCRKDMGSFGAAMVKACVDQDIEAAITLAGYPDKHNNVIARCHRDMGGYGYAMVRACVDQDIDAERALADY